jgi:hypothetical protein
MKVNRRELGALLAAAAAGVATAERANAQTPPRDFLAEARLQHAADSAAMAKVELPPSTEPAFEFHS